jgi:AraC-like DNA-binding protein
MEAYLALSNINLALFLSLATLNLKVPGNRWMSLLLLNYSAYALLRWGVFSKNQMVILYAPLISLPAIFGFGSVLLIYIDHALFTEKKQRYFQYLILPFVALTSHVILLIFFRDEMTVVNILEQKGIHRYYTFYSVIAGLLYNFALCWMSLVKVINYKKRFEDTFSNDKVLNVRWLLIFTTANIFIFVFTAVVMAISLINNMRVPVCMAEDLLLLFIFLIFIYYLITKPEILPVENQLQEKQDEKYSRNKLSTEKIKQYAFQLNRYMEHEKPYLNENVSIGTFSDALGTPQHHLSMVINSEFNLNFFNFINTHRIHYVERILNDQAERNESLLSIAFRSGYQSKSTFNKHFKSIIGMTPSEYSKSRISAHSIDGA